MSDGKMFRQHVEKLDLDVVLKYTKAVHDEGLSLAVEIATEIAYRDAVIARQAAKIQTLNQCVDEYISHHNNTTIF